MEKQVVVFKAKICKFGKRWIINIPKALYLQLQPTLNKKAIITIEYKMGGEINNVQ